MVATTLVTACPPSFPPPPSTIYFSSRPRFTATIICFYVRSWKSFRLSRTSPLLSSSPLSPCPARFPLAETSRVLFLPSPREKFKRGGNLRDSLSLPPPPPSSRGIRGERRKADRKFRSLWIKVFSKLPCPPLPIPRHPYLALSVQVASAGLRGNGRGGTLDDVFYICRGVELIGERGRGASFREWNSVPRLQDQPGEISGINSGLDIDFVKMPDRHHLRTDGEFTGGGCLDDLLGIDVVAFYSLPLTPLEMLSGFNVWLSSNGWTKFVWRCGGNFAICFLLKVEL